MSAGPPVVSQRFHLGRRLPGGGGGMRAELLVSERHRDGKWHARYPTAERTLCGRVGEVQARGRRWQPDCGLCSKVARRFHEIDGSMPAHWRVEAQRTPRRRATDAEIAAALRAFEVEHGRPPYYAEWRTQGRWPSISVIYRRFGSWDKALEAAGLREAA